MSPTQIENGVTTIGQGGSGSEANILIQLRTAFPGIGGRINTQQAVVAVLREEYSESQKLGHRMFLKHAIIKKLEDFFQLNDIYRFPHIPRPFGSISRSSNNPYEAYIYEWAHGSDGFAWGYQDIEMGFVYYKLIDWKEFVEAFLGAGIDLSTDSTNSDDARISQNVVHQLYETFGGGDKRDLNPLWKRIDFGSRSIRIDYDRLYAFLLKNKEELKIKLSTERFDLMILALEYLTDFKNMDRVDIGRLDALAGQYRVASLRHYSSSVRGAENISVAEISSRNQSLL